MKRQVKRQLEGVYPQWLKEYPKAKISDEDGYIKYKKYYKGKLLLNYDRFLIIDWKNSKRIDLTFHYFFRKDIGTFHMFTYYGNHEITANWISSIDLDAVMNAMLCPEYFASKVRNDKEKLVEWNDNLGLQELQKARKESEAFYKNDAEILAVVHHDYDEMVRLFNKYGINVVDDSDEFYDLWYKYHDLDNPISDLGLTMSSFAYWGIKGFFDACADTGLVTFIEEDEVFEDYEE